MLLGLLFSACASQPSSLEPAASATFRTTLAPSESSEPSPGAIAAMDLLACDGGPSDVGGLGEDVAIDGGGSTPDEALTAFLANSPYVIPRTGYEPISQAGQRRAYGYRASGEVKVVVVISPRFGELVGHPFAVDELRTCPDAEYGSDAEFDDGRRAWTHVETGLVLTDIAGPGHCGWESARLLHVPNPDGSLGKQYLRDPNGVFGDVPLRDTYAEGVSLPKDASDSGYRSPEVYELWFSESDTAAYVVTPKGVERWPRAAEPIGCT